MSNRRFVWVSCSGRELVTSFTSRGDPEHILQAISEEFGVRIDHLTPSPLPRATAVASVRPNRFRFLVAAARFAYRHQSTTAWTSRSNKQQGVVVLQAFLISIFCCFFATSAGFGNLIRSTPLSNFASTFAGSGSNGKGIAR